ncbi:MAG: UbiH/UbiF/VisC/COQ6 family ubiquinone biosynthesis hydroxylase [Alphaproteobacteria bacterium]
MQRVIIIGGGLVGATTAIALAQQGVPVTIIDNQAPSPNQNLDGRTTAVSYGSKLIFDNLGLWPLLAAHASPILQIRVFEEGSPWQVAYDSQTIGNHPMGFIIANPHLRQALWDRAQEFTNLTWIAPAQVVATHYHPACVELHLNTGETISGQLLVAAEGRHSPTTKATGIPQTSWSYEQAAFVCTVHHAVPHDGVAWEIFSTRGAYALLPLTPCSETGTSRSGVVFTLPLKQANDLMAKDSAEISHFLSEHFRFYVPLQLVGESWCYPLSAMKLERIIDQRLAIVGDAAHVVHPIAGQGVNLGWRDAAALAFEVGEAFRNGLDIGSQTVLTRYQKQRQPDHRQMLQMTDGIVRLYGKQSTLFYFLRNAGLGIVEQLPPLKRLLMKHAMGIS